MWRTTERTAIPIRAPWGFITDGVIKWQNLDLVDAATTGSPRLSDQGNDNHRGQQRTPSHAWRITVEIRELLNTLRKALDENFKVVICSNSMVRVEWIAAMLLSRGCSPYWDLWQTSLRLA